MRSIKQDQDPPHALCFFINATAKWTPEIKNALRCFAQCLKPPIDGGVGLPHGRAFLIVNQLARTEDLLGDAFSSVTRTPAQAKEELAKQMDKTNDMVSQFLEMDPKFQYITLWASKPLVERTEAFWPSRSEVSTQHYMPYQTSP